MRQIPLYAAWMIAFGSLVFGFTLGWNVARENNRNEWAQIERERQEMRTEADHLFAASQGSTLLDDELDTALERTIESTEGAVYAEAKVWGRTSPPNSVPYLGLYEAGDKDAVSAKWRLQCLKNDYEAAADALANAEEVD